MESDGGQGYRDAVLSCPGCESEMTPQLLETSTIDLCESCGGGWFDWFDGHLPQLVRAARVPRTSGAPDLDTARCPRCVVDLRAETFGEGGPALLRCGECLGAFVPRSSFDPLLALDEHASPTDADSVLFRLRRLLRRLLPGRG